MDLSGLSKFRGHDICRRGGEWVFEATGKTVADHWEAMPCGHCQKHNTPEGHDACVGTLPNVSNACCGHGETTEAYIQFVNGDRVHGQKALDLIEVAHR